MANLNAIYTVGSQTKPPTLLKDEYPQWKIRMIHFHEGIDKALLKAVLNGPFVPMVTTERIPATDTIAEVPERTEPKSQADWSDAEWDKVEVSNKAKRLLIMAIPNDIFQSLDACVTAQDLWLELEKQLEGGVKTQKNRKSQCLNEFFSFSVKQGESLQLTYDRFNTLINKCKKVGIQRSREDNNTLFLKSLNEEWLQLSMSLQSNQDLDEWLLHDIYGTLAAPEQHVVKPKPQLGGPLAWSLSPQKL